MSEENAAISEESEVTDEDNVNLVVFYLFLIVVGMALLYVGGWSLVWGEYLRGEDLVIESRGLAVRFNGLFYGARITSRFFDSPVVSWLLLIGAFSVFGASPSEES
jgi:hypothetical protein